MRCLCAMLAGLVVLATTAPAMASPCGGDSSSSDSGGSSSDSGSSSSDSGSSDDDSGSDDSSSGTSAAPACLNTTSIVGRAECQRFGGWDRQVNVPMRFTMALLGGSTSVAGMEFDGRASHDKVHAYHYPTEPSVRNRPEDIALGGMEMQGTTFVSDKVHVGLHTGFAFGSSKAGEKQIGELLLRPQSVLQLSAAGVVGLNIPLGSWTLRSEALIGLRSTNLSIETQRDDCVALSSAWNNELLLEPRVGVEKWINPWLSAGLMVGSDLMQTRDLSVSLGITGHTTPKDSSGVVGLGR